MLHGSQKLVKQAAHAATAAVQDVRADRRRADVAGIPNTAWRAAQRKLKQLDLVATLDDLKIPPATTCMPSGETRPGATPSG